MVYSARLILKTTIFLSIFLNSLLLSSQELPELRWAADAESGAPYVFQNPDNTSELIGFEVDIIKRIAHYLNMKPVHVQNQWDGLIPGLGRMDYSLVINGIEITSDREEKVNFSKPYFVTFLQIIVRKDETRIQSFSDLIGKNVGTLSACYAEKLMNSKGGINVKGYESEVNSFTDLKNGRLDAVLIDFPVALVYAVPDSIHLKLVGLPIGEITYGIVMRKEDSLLLGSIDSVITKMWMNGEIRSILMMWDLWNDLLQRWDPITGKLLPPDTTKPKPKVDTTASNVRIIGAYKPTLDGYISMMPALLQGAWKTVYLSILSMILAVLLGLVVSLIRIYAPPPFSQIATAYIEIIRGTPLLIQLYFIYYSMPLIGIFLSPLEAAIIGLGCNYAAYEAENYRAGIFSVPKGQMEAAIALGLKRGQALRYIIVPQAIRLVIPPITNDFISLLKDSSLVSMITMIELTKTYQLITAANFDFVGVGLLTAALYLIIGLPFVRLSKWAEVKFSPEKQKR